MKANLPLTLLLLTGGLLTGTLHFALPPVEAYAESGYVKSELPTTIDLNDVAEASVRSYYAGLAGKKLAGNDLLKALKPILMNGQKYHSYDVSNGKDIWRMYEIIDRDWNLSPASETTYGNYDSAHNVITDYKYGSSTGDSKNNPEMRILYRNRDENGSMLEDARIKAWGVHGNQGGVDGIDREHIWPKSRGFGENVTYVNSSKVTDTNGGDYGARGDVMHLWAGDHYVNSTSHNNFSYGFVSPAARDDDASTSAYYLCGNYRGTSASLGNKKKVFEPQDCDKGDIARACFYMVARYNNLSGTDYDIDSGNPNLYLDDSVDQTSINSTPSTPVSIGVLRDLLAWHRLDPVDDFEIHRNNLCYNNYTNNRNPFVDYPDWVEAIWGSVSFDEANHRVTAHDTTPVGYADPERDDVRTIGESWATLTSISVSGQTTEFTVGDDFAFGGTVTGTYSDASQADVTAQCAFSGYDMNTAGEQTVTVTHVKTGLTTSYKINVVEPVVPVSLSLSGQKTAFYLGDEFAFGGTVTLHYSDSTFEDVTDACAFSGYDMEAEGQQTVTVSHAASGLNTTYQITVSKPAPIVSSTGYTLLRSASELRVGDTIVLGAYSNNDSAYYGMGEQKKNFRAADPVTAPSLDVLTLGGTEGVKVFDLGKDDGYWTIRGEDGYLAASSSTSNYLSTVSTVNDGARWTIAIDETGDASIVAKDTSLRCCIRFNFNAGNPRFACYAENSTVKTKPMIFKDYGAEMDNYGKAFLNTYTGGCKSSGIGSTIDWSLASSAFAALSSGAKGSYASVTAKESGTYSQKAAARYDYIVGKYGVGTYANFMGRSVKANATSFGQSINQTQGMQIALIAIFALFGASAVTYFLYNHKKKKA